MTRIKTAIFPVAGRGARLLPATRVIPKEMLPVVERPLIEYALEEAAAAGIETFILVTGPGKHAIEDHLEGAPWADRIVCVRQSRPLGLGHAVWRARALVGDAPFAVLCPDDLIRGPTPCIGQLAEAHGATGGSVVAVMEAPRSEVSRYGVLDTPEPSARLAPVRGLVEKPRPDEAPSTLCIVGRYVLSPAVFDHLARQERGAGGEIQLTDAIAALVGREPVHGLRFEGARFDCGDRLGWLEANMTEALQRSDLASGARALVRRLAAPMASDMTSSNVTSSKA